MEFWGGIECTVNRVGDSWYDQVVRTGHHTRIEDLERIAALGVSALRYPVLWERVAPISLAEPDFTWSDARLARLRELRLRPIVGLVHHGSGPAYTSLLDAAFPAQLAAYARAVAERYPWVGDYTPINEPLTTARFSALYGLWYPHQRDARAFVRAFLLQMRGIVLAMEAIRAVNPAARLIQTEDCGLTTGTAATQRQVDYEEHRRWLTFDVLTGRVDTSHPLYRFLIESGATESELAFFCERPCPPDVVGLNYYLTSDRYLDDCLERYPPHLHGGNGAMRYADVEAVRAADDGIVGHQRHLIDAWLRYELPVAVTEAHLACSRDEQSRWLVDAWKGASAARAAGADVHAVTAWSLFGAYDWDTLVTQVNNRYEPGAFDIRGATPRATAVAAVVTDLCHGREPDHPIFEGAGWWHRPQRLCDGVRRAGEVAARVRPILIAGAGTLGRAFQHMCTTRGLSSRLTTRGELDITCTAQVENALSELRPWAVINAAGYVRVDDAERERERCHQTNVVGAINLARACERRRIPLVTFSSDLVFDGTLRRPYVETDPPRPLNVYGRSKMQAEDGVFTVLPTALVIRTSAFFGPWDSANFAARVLATLARGERCPAADDCVVSPTYVPHLVDATLDLLIDGQHGVWHLANQGALTWLTFARLVADAVGTSTASIVSARMSDVCGPAPRPRYSALDSVRGRVMMPLADAIAAFAADAHRQAWARSLAI